MSADGASDIEGAEVQLDVADAASDGTADGAEAEAQVVEAELDDLAKMAAERDDYLDALRRVQADFENYKKRVQKQQAEQAERAAESLVLKLLPVLDAVDLALAHAGEGVTVLHPVAATLHDVLRKEGLERIEPIGESFDPTQHEAVAHEAGEGDEGPQVSEVLRAGYRWNSRVLRPAMVKVTG